MLSRAGDTCCRAEEEREYLKGQQHELERRLEAASKAEADARAEAKHAQIRFEDRDHELGERAALLRRQEAELVRPPLFCHCNTAEDSVDIVADWHLVDLMKQLPKYTTQQQNVLPSHTVAIHLQSQC